MLQDNFIRYGKNVRIIFEDINLNFVANQQTSLSLNSSIISNYADLDMTLIFDSLYLFKNIIIVDKNSFVYNFRVDEIDEENNTIGITYFENLNIIPSFMFLNERRILSSTYDKVVSIENIKEFGQTFIDNQLTINMLIDLNKPKFTNVYKYTIKYKVDDGQFEEVTLSQIQKDNRGREFLRLQLNIIDFNKFFYKVSAHYKHNGKEDVSFYNNLNVLEKNNII